MNTEEIDQRKSKGNIDNHSKARRRASIQMQIREFTTTFRGISERAILAHDIQALFKPANVKQERFKNLALNGTYPAISTNIVCTQDIFNHVMSNIIKLGHLILDIRVNKFLANEEQMIRRISDFICFVYFANTE